MLDTTSVLRERELARFKEPGQFAPRLRELLESAGLLVFDTDTLIGWKK